MSLKPYRQPRPSGARIAAHDFEQASLREERVIALALTLAGASAMGAELLGGHTTSIFTLGLLVFFAGAFVGLTNERRIRASRNEPPHV
ncbi:MAG: hypothetical protein U0235_21605 [Polyangiaceae bacterium]